ncbi:MAG: repressor LexA [Clostridiales bacterium]|nr:repressor LexA [Clostridiales bacterium]
MERVFQIERIKQMRTKNEETILNIIEYINEKFFTVREIPSVQEIADHIGIAKSSASRYLSLMESRGLVKRGDAYYSIQTLKIQKAMKNVQQLPIVGDIACGTPILAEQNIESYLTISGDFLGTGNFFVLMAKGNSMINVGIEDGDYVVIRQQPSADEGQIIVAMTEDGECTLKRYYKDRRRKKIRLHPENDEMEDMYYDNIEIQGVAVKVIKNLENV